MLHNVGMKNGILNNDFVKLHISVLLAGFTGVFGKLISLNEGLLVWYRLLISFAMFYVILFIAKKIPHMKFKNVLKISGLGMLLGLHFLFFYGSIKYSNISVGVVCYSLVGFFTAIFEPFIYKRKLSIKELFYSLIAVAGIALIFNIDTHFQLGIILGVISAAIFAVYTIYNKIIEVGKPVRCMLFYELLGGTIFVSLILPFYLHLNSVALSLPNLSDLSYLLILAFFCTIGLYILHIQVLKTISAFTVSLSGNLEPIYGILLAVLLFGEAKELTLTFYMGMFLILFSVFLQSISALKSQKTPVKIEEN